MVEPYQRELQVHCYRFLGSIQDAEDMVQETLLTAWRSLDGFEQRAALRTWLYRIATSRCLNALRAASRRPAVDRPLRFDPPEPTRLAEVTWLEPYPDILLESLPDKAPGPHARYEAKEAISLAFVTALQVLPPRQRAALILRDVLGFSTNEVAGMLESSEQSVASALKRARATLAVHAVRAAPTADSAAERRLVDAFARAFEEGDVDRVVALLTDDAWVTMPPLPMEYQGRELAARFLSVACQARRSGGPRLVATRANGQPAFGSYTRDAQTGIFHATGVLVLTLAGERISALTRFDNSALARFGLPRTLPG
jgi:RNA polymerase sigma-70 factor (ECF subfamily)